MDIDTIIQIVTSPVTWTVLGALVAKFAPGWMPFLGTGRKLADELADLHGNSRTSNAKIIDSADLSGFKKAAKFLEKRLKK